MQMKRFGWNRESLLGLVVSLSIGAPTYLIDLAIIYFSIHKLHFTYPHAVATGFIVGAFFNYAMNRTFVYANSRQPHMRAMLTYFAIAFIWFWFTVGGTVFLVDYVQVPNLFGIDHIYVARSIVGIFVGVMGYIISSLITFKIPTK